MGISRSTAAWRRSLLAREQRQLGVRAHIGSILWFLFVVSFEQGQSWNFAFGCGSVFKWSRFRLFVKTLKSLWEE